MTRGYRWFGLLALPALLVGCGDAGEPGGGQPWTGPDGNGITPEAWIPAAGDTNEAYFVEFESPPVARGGSLLALKAERDEFHRQAKRAGVRYSPRLAFGDLWNGISIRVEKDDLAELSRVPGVKAIFPVIPIVLDDAGTTAGGEEQELATAITMTGANIAQDSFGLSGEGVRVGVIDTGIDFDNPDLGGCFGPGCRVAYGIDLVGDAYDSNTNPVPAGDDIPDDCGGHGSHVAGIVGANGVVIGVAPAVTYGAYRVFGCNGSTSADIMMTAMEKAWGDGMRVVNMSIGSGYTWPQYPSAVAADNLVDAGVIVVTSGGNNGTNGLYATGAPGLGKKVISVASFENSHVRQAYFSLANGTKIGYLTATASAAVPVSGTSNLVRLGTPTTTNDGCTGSATAPAPGSLTGKVVLIRRGTCPFYEKTKNAEAAGAIGVVLYNNTTGFISPTVAGTPAVTIPVVAITAADGAALNQLMDGGAQTMTWANDQTSVPNPDSGQLSSFSSYGPSPDLVMKPDIGAPGGNIYSTLPLEQGGHGTLSGTSMASPHVAGLVALLLQAQNDIDTDSARTLLQNTAVPVMRAGQTTPDFTFRQGAGMARIDKAALETVLVSPSKLSVGESDAGPYAQTLTIKNRGGTAETFTLSHRPSLSITGTTLAPTTATTGYAGVTFSQPSVTVPAGGTASVDVTITPDPQSQLPQGALFGGYIVLTSGRTLSVPYAGFKGDYQAITAITSKALTKYSNGSYVTQANGAKYTMGGTDRPYVTVHYAHQVTQIKLDVYAVANPSDPNYLNKLKAQGNALTVDYVGRNSTATENTNYLWNGTTKSGKTTYTVPNGYYVIKLSALKALGNSSNPAHWETWTSPIITIARQ